MACRDEQRYGVMQLLHHHQNQPLLLVQFYKPASSHLARNNPALPAGRLALLDEGSSMGEREIIRW